MSWKWKSGLPLPIKADESFDPPEGDDENGDYAPSHYISTESEQNPALLLEYKESEESDQSGLQQALASLDERSREIIQQRWLSEEKTNLKELAGRYQVSMERIRQIEAQAMKKMRGYLEAAG